LAVARTVSGVMSAPPPEMAMIFVSERN
jgi:hypothetical protein